MRRAIHHRLWYLVVLGLILSDVTVASAQPATYVDSVSVSQQSHVVRYPQTRTDAAERVKAALQKILPVYETYWNAPPPGASARPVEFRMLVDLGVSNPAAGANMSNASFQTLALPIPSVPATWPGNTEATTTNVCAI
jgi:hypothetical protein